MTDMVLIWISRIALLGFAYVLGQGIFAILDPQDLADRIWLTLEQPMSATYLRIGFGAMPFSLAVLALACATRPAWFHIAFVVGLVNAATVISTRFVGIALDGGARQYSLLAIESTVMSALVIGCLANIYRLRRAKAAVG